MNPFKELSADVWPIAHYIVRWVANGFADIRIGVVRLCARLVRAEQKNSLLADLWQLLLTVLRYPMQLILTIGSVVLNALASFLNNIFHLSSERKLNEQELVYLQRIFGRNLNYAAIRIQSGGVKEKLNISPQAVGADIFLRKVWGVPIINDDCSLTPAGLRLLGHEACHVWQYQHAGAGYIGDSLITQWFDVIGRGLGVRLSDGYDVLPALHAKLRFEQCNVEQQAVLAELMGVVCGSSGANCLGDTEEQARPLEVNTINRCASDGTPLTRIAFNRTTDFNLTDAEFETVQDAHACLSGSSRNELTDL